MTRRAASASSCGTRPHHTLLPEAGTGPRVFYLT